MPAWLDFPCRVCHSLVFCFGGRVEIEEARELLGVDGHLYTGACGFGAVRGRNSH